MSNSGYQEALSHLVSIVESSHDSIYSQDMSGRITSWNLGAKVLYGYDSEEIIGQPVEIMIPDEKLVEQELIISKIKSGNRSKALDTLRKHKDGHLIDVSLRLSPILDSSGKLYGISSISHDITERIKVERKLAQLAAIVESSDDAIVSTNMDGIIESWNNGATKMFGFTAEEVIGKDAAFLIVPEERNEERPLRRVIESGERIEHYETIRQAKDGSYVKISLSLSPIKDKSGNLIGVSGIARDISEHEWYEEAETRRRLAQSQLSQLTQREREVLDQVVLGNPNKVIARKLQLSEKTIEKHRSKLMKKLNAKSLAELVRISIPAL